MNLFKIGHSALLFFIHLSSLSVGPILIEPSFAAPTDVNGDGRSELVVATTTDQNVLQFSAVDLSNAQVTSLGSLGQLGDHVALGSWVSAAPQLAVVKDAGASLNWELATSTNDTVSVDFGARDFSFVSGADLTGDGRIDAISTGGANRRREWKTVSGLFSDSKQAQDISFGFTAERPLYIHGEGRDLLATLSIGTRGVTALRTYDLVTGKKHRIRLARAPALMTPLPIRYSTASSGIVYAVASGPTTLLYYHALNARIPVIEGAVAATGTVVIGDYLPEEGEEVGIHSGSTLFVHSRLQNSTTQFTVPEGIAVDEVNSNSFVSSTPTPENPAPPSDTPTVPSDPSLAAVCATTNEISPGEMLIKSDPSQHIGRHDPRTSGYTVVCAAQCPANVGYAPFYYANGELAGAVAKYGLFSGNGRPRLYGAVGRAPAHDAREIATRAKTIGNGKLYLQISSATSGVETKCKEFHPSGRNGSL